MLNPHQREANMVVFAHAELGAHDRNSIFKDLGDIVLQVGEGVGQLPGFSADDFRYFESQRSPQEEAEAEYRAGLLEGYQPFSAQIEHIKSELKEKPAKEVDGFLASGNESDVFIVESNGKSFAARISKVKPGEEAYRNAEHIDTYLDAAFLVAGIEGTEKLVGLSYRDGATIGELIPGKPLGEYSAEEIAAIPEEHFRKLAKTIVSAARVGISLDGNEGNLLYDPENGFGFVDLGVRTGRSENHGIAQPVTTSVFGTDTWLPQGQIPASEHVEDYEVLKNVLLATIPTYDRWLEILVEIQAEMGIGPDYLTRMDELQETAANLKTALAELAPEGAYEAFVQKSRAVRQVRIASVQGQIDRLEPGFMRDNKLKALEQYWQEPGRLFPKGSVRPTRNDGRK